MHYLTMDISKFFFLGNKKTTDIISMNVAIPTNQITVKLGPH